MKKEEVLNGLSTDALDQVHALLAGEEITIGPLDMYLWLKRLQESTGVMMGNLRKSANQGFQELVEKDPNRKRWQPLEFASLAKAPGKSSWKLPPELVAKQTELKTEIETAKKDGTATKVDLPLNPDSDLLFRTSLHKF